MSASDREMFIKAILDIKQEVEDLKKTVYGGEGTIPHPHQLAGPEMPEADWQGQGAPVSSGEVRSVALDDDAEEQPQPQDESLSINNASKELIIKALERSGGNRKLAAAELGISERTLYRKIEKFGLDTKPTKK
jgi:DNA-binding NtrC family response regulator